MLNFPLPYIVSGLMEIYKNYQYIFSISFFLYCAGLGLLSVNESINIHIFTPHVYTFVLSVLYMFSD